MKEKVFAVGDIHGEYDLLKKLLDRWKEEEETLVFLGDLGDRGPKSKECFLLVQDLVTSNRAVCLSGNHEDIFLSWLDNPEEKFMWYLRNGGQETLESLLYPGVLEEKTPQELAKEIQATYPDLITFMRDLPLYYETDFCICVHAGIDLDLEDWRETSRRDFLWSRADFYANPKTPEKLVVFGHTPVQYLHGDSSDTSLWHQNARLNIDGGAVYEGALHGVVISDQGLEEDHQIFHPNYQLPESKDASSVG